MNILKIFVFISILLITLITVSNKPTMHKHFIIESPGFHMSGITARPKDIQSSVLFKLGERKYKLTKQIETVTERTDFEVSNSSKIIPSTIFQSFQSSTKQVNTTKKDITQTEPKHENYNHKRMEVASKLYNDKKISEDKLDEIMADIFIETAKQNNQPMNNTNRWNRMENNGGMRTTAYCPVCDKKRDPKLYQEELSWNIWRSNVQNMIMDNTEVRGDLGDWFIFSFEVNKSKKIEKVFVYASNWDKFSKNSIEREIKNLQGKNILEFPKGTKRTSVFVEGGFIVDNSVQYSRPEDFNDYETIQYYK